MPRYRVSGSGSVDGQDQGHDLGARFLDETAFWEEAFANGDPMRRFHFHVSAEEIEGGATEEDEDR